MNREETINAQKAWIIAQWMTALNNENDFEEKELFNIRNTQGFSGTKNGVLYVSFQGTANEMDIKADIDFIKVNIGEKAKIHRGFYGQFQDVDTHVFQKAYKAKRVIFSGNSLGGSIAIISAFMTKRNLPLKEIECVTFASPKVGNSKFAQNFIKMGIGIKQYRYRDDMICLLPPWIFGYRDITKPIRYGTYKWWEYLFFPITKLFGNPFDHNPQNYIKDLPE